MIKAKGKVVLPKCPLCGEEEHVVDYEEDYYECELCELKFSVKTFEEV